MKSLMALASVCLLTSSTANANGCRVQKVVQEVAAVVPVVPVIQAVTIPLYNYSYAPPVYAPPPQPVYQQPQQQIYQPPQQQVQQQQVQQQAVEQPVGDCCSQLVAELAKLRSEIAALRGAPPIASAPGQLPPNAALPPGANLMTARCAQCHTAGKNPKGELELFAADGKPLPLSLQYKNRILRRVNNGTMPPREGGGPLSDAEKAGIAELLKTP